MYSVTFYFLRLIASFVSFFQSEQTCESCVGSGNEWCIETSTCNQSMIACAGLVTHSLNCPRFPDSKYEFNDEFMRKKQFVLISAVQCHNPQICFDNQLPTMRHFRKRTVNCTSRYPDVTCVGYTSYDTTQKVIALVFKGSAGKWQVKQLDEDARRFGLRPYFNGNGRIFKVIFDSFMLLWNGGIGEDLLELQRRFPTYELWVNGHSFGALLAFTASSYVATTGMFKPEHMKVVGMGASRMGDYQFAEWFSRTFPFSYRIVHHRDLVPRNPAFDPHSGIRMWHPRTEVWYDNNMKKGAKFEICPEADGYFCSNRALSNLTIQDHLYYFNLNLADWGRDGCPENNRTAYEQPE